MRHPDISDWTDYVRSIDGENERTDLQSHLDEGCEPCRGLVSTLERVSMTAERDGAITPPDGLVRSVKAFFHLQHPETGSGWGELALHRESDSAQGHAMASRSAAQVTRQMLFRSDEYSLELSLDHSPGEVDAVLRGQLLETDGEPRSHTPVFPDDENRIRLSLEPEH